MQPTISIPKHWDYPSFTFGQRTQQEIILGLEYHPADTQLAYEYGKSLCSNSKCKIQNAKLLSSSILNFELLILNCLEVRHYSDKELQTLSLAQIQAQIQVEIKQHQQQIKALQQQLVAITGGSSDG